MTFVRKMLISVRNFFIKQKPFFSGYNKKFPVNMANSRCAISHSGKFIYFRIPKSANSTVVASLSYAETGVLPSEQADIRKIKKSYSLPSTVSRSDMGSVNDYYKFSIVRNPYTRIVSAYVDKVHRGKPEKAKVARYFSRDVNEHISFDEFLSYLESGGIYEDAHWAPQTDLIFIPIEELDYLGKIETIGRDLPFILNELFKKSDIVDWRPHASSHEKVKIELDSNQKKKIYALYKNDFISLGYDC
ncbi:sulfotransferase family protein [Aestuariicella sp. G3-2]|uniref:sulfotransferase family protein n=1 Tax=Pseudomaricurvus albidus TaxID=2842452 RepID=UPI001C0CCA58|nr:sulfotransferase family protein [Aestuariicella albida]MBU3071675.1 sulfotransferase family protein [Aestuariicella albida]